MGPRGSSAFPKMTVRGRGAEGQKGGSLLDLSESPILLVVGLLEVDRLRHHPREWSRGRREATPCRGSEEDEWVDVTDRGHKELNVVNIN